jgi:hypothetical protein
MAQVVVQTSSARGELGELKKHGVGGRLGGLQEL